MDGIPLNCVSCGAVMTTAREDVSGLYFTKGVNMHRAVLGASGGVTLVQCVVHRCSCGECEMEFPALDDLIRLTSSGTHTRVGYDEATKTWMDRP